ncbi:LLM class flavin-dependent oxidoreductase [Iamia sp. SCSIO 61187]|uniref:LLM class flavin-dependent oxidoreductase n=1 Tax=Iamia sp. SCSIO 61187 TaxID=2722752 RepID=UPI001C62A4F3|nr:LLM class flavin-dependent oxidoreductase [Iamia sp. SCSIO 61187]QYG93272.1 LLM class flavin-dependent oxidoreductase [Iamia sp. SCSIO 61187]
MQNGLYLAPFAEMSEPAAVVEVARAAEAAGWDGLFLWDHVLRPVDEVTDIADVWITLAAVAAATERIRLGPMVTPPSRRRIGPLVRQTTTLDRLSGGRLIVGLGLGVDSGGELTRFGEVIDPRTRAAILDESAEVLAAAWAGEHVVHRGEHLTVDGVTFAPRPVQQPRIPLWFAARGSALRPVRRAARYDGLFLIEATVEDLERAQAEVRAVRGGLDGFAIAVSVSPLDDPALRDVPGVSWAMHSMAPVETLADLLEIATAGPP